LLYQSNFSIDVLMCIDCMILKSVVQKLCTNQANENTCHKGLSNYCLDHIRHGGLDLTNYSIDTFSARPKMV